MGRYQCSAKQPPTNTQRTASACRGTSTRCNFQTELRLPGAIAPEEFTTPFESLSLYRMRPEPVPGLPVALFRMQTTTTLHSVAG